MALPILSPPCSLAPLGIWARPTNYAAIGSLTNSVELIAPGRFTWNSDGTVSLHTGVFDMGGFTLTVVDHPGSVGTPEPASLILLSLGGLALGALRRRKAS